PGVVLDHQAATGLLAGLRQAVLGPATVATGRTRLRVRLSAHPADDGFLRQLLALLDGHTLVVGSGPADVVDCPPDGLAKLGADPPPVVVVGSRTPIGARERARAAALDRSVVHYLFGPPECGFAATVELAAEGGTRLTVGRPLAHVIAEVLDPSGARVPVQVAGELHLTRRGLARHATGHLARRLPDGRLEVLGATEAATLLRGLRIDRRLVEAAIARHAAVRRATVTIEGAEDGDPHLVAHVIPEGAHGPSFTELRVHLWEQLPGYAWPRKLVIPPSENVELDDGSASRTPEERLLGGAWADVLGVDTVSREQNYWLRFSFLDAVARLREAGMRLGNAQVARNRTLRTLASDLAAARRRAGRGSQKPSLPGRENAM
ncbi:MAG: hypothetical protein M3179_04860, partial [Actinomycetota bacterium]|nr:hypothetical protein [Actinomycetota bacterium]